MDQLLTAIFFYSLFYFGNQIILLLVKSLTKKVFTEPLTSAMLCAFKRFVEKAINANDAGVSVWWVREIEKLKRPF